MPTSRFTRRLCRDTGRRVAMPLVLAGLVAGTPAAQQTAFSPAGPGPLSIADCSDRYGAGARCGIYTVFEDRRARTGRTIPLQIVVLSATGTARPDPVFFLAGGPGQAATRLAGAIGSLLPGVRRHRDIVLVDQRGTGRSNGLNCPLRSTRDLLASLSLAIGPDRIAQCRREMNADLGLYTTPIAMDDLEEIRQALGYDKINLFGGSYGTRAAQVYLRRHPGQVRSMVLRGVTTTGSRLPLYFARDGQRAFERVSRACAADPQCGARYADINQKLAALMKSLRREPARVHVTEPSGERVEVEITADAMAGGIRLLLYGTSFSRLIPLILEEGLAGRFDTFLQSALALERRIVDGLSLGMFLSVVCTEDLPYIDPEEGRKLAEGSFIGEGPVRYLSALCREWPKGRLPAEYSEPVRSDLPTLLLSGTEDPVTPPDWAEQVGRHLPNSRHIVMPETGHIPSAPGCAGPLVAQFLEAPDGHLEAACVQSLQRPAFVMP